jgi:hypothetical protein
MKSACYPGENQRQPARKTIMGEAEFPLQVQLTAAASAADRQVCSLFPFC